MIFTAAREATKTQVVATICLTVILFSTALLAGQAIPSGTIIPVQLNSSLNSKNAKPGRVFTARVMQHVPGTSIHAGSKVVGHVVSAKPSANGTEAELSLQFDAIRIKNEQIPVSTHLRAIASMVEVEEAQVPLAGPDRGTSPSAWTTVQVGGEVVYRGGGPVANGLRSVGMPTANGVLARISSPPGSKCGADVSQNEPPQALWVFSSDACGAYGYSDLEIVHTGRTDPIGRITLISRQGNILLRSGSGLLLMANSSAPV